MPRLGLGANIGKQALTAPGIITDGLVLKSNFDTGEVAPISDGSASFDGTDDYIDVGDSTNFITGTNVTISTWFKNSSGTRAYMFQSRRGAGSSNLSVGVNMKGDGAELAGWIGIIIYTGSGHSYAAYDGNVDDGAWHHFAVTVSDGAQKLYLDGSEVASASNAFPNDASADHSLIGSNSGSDRFMNGNMCNVGIWSAALTAAQIKSIMYKNYSGLTSSETTNLVSWWNLSADANDNHGSNNGTLSGS